MAAQRPDRRTLIADVAIAVLAEGGARSLTHRAVDAAAGLAPGSTSYYFRSREALMIAAARRLADLDLAEAVTASEAGPATARDLVAVLSELTHAQITDRRGRTLARYRLSLEAGQYPQVRMILDEQGQRFAAAATALLSAGGASRPPDDARALIAVCAGIVFESTAGAQRPFTREEIREILSDFIAARVPASPGQP